MKNLILIADDEVDIQDLIAYNLEKNGFETSRVGRGDAVVLKAREIRPSLIILDIVMPGISGIEAFKQMRLDPTIAMIPTIMVTSKTSEQDRILGFDLGVDDYITKPFSVHELVARVKAVLKRNSQPSRISDGLLERGKIKIDLHKHKAYVNSKDVELTLSEFKMLCEFLNSAGRVLRREELFNVISGTRATIAARNVDVHLSSLRKKIRESGEIIETVRGLGYRLKT